MYSLSNIRRRIDSLRRKYSLELSVAELHSIFEDFCARWARAVGDSVPVPDYHRFPSEIGQKGFRFHTYGVLVKYLKRCQKRNDLPDSLGILSCLLPEIPHQVLWEMVADNAPSPA